MGGISSISLFGERMKISAFGNAFRVMEANSRVSVSVSNIAVWFRGLVIVQIQFAKMQPSHEQGGRQVGMNSAMSTLFFNSFFNSIGNYLF